MAKQRARLTDNNDPLTSTDSVFATLEQASKSTSQQSNNLASQEVNKSGSHGTQETDKAALEQVNNLESQQVSKPVIRKSTFQLSEEILKQLDRYHLQLQLDLGKADAPYKEVIVEEAIAQFLVSADPKNLDKLRTRQSTR